MYTNYLLKSLGQKVWWAKYLTQGQIVQFITGTVYSGAFLYMQSNGFGCTGSARTAIFSNVVNFSFIVLFLGVSFYPCAHTYSLSLSLSPALCRARALSLSLCLHL
jgi:hypothetical protein